MSENQRPSEGVALSFDNVTVRMGGLSILQGVKAGVPKGSFTAIIGPNGAGKTTLLLALLGTMPYSGTIRSSFPGGMRGLRIGYVPQRLDFDRAMPLTVMEMIAMGHQRRPLWFGVKPRVRREVMELLEAVGAIHLAHRHLGALSGGERQRVLLALALQRNPNLLLLDEPAAGVDYRGEQLLCGLLDRLRIKHGFTQLMVTHDLAIVAAHATHVICLNRVVIREGTPQEVLTAEVLESTFGIHRGLPDPSGLPNGLISQHDLRRCVNCR